MAKKTWAERWGESEVNYSNKAEVEKTLRKIRNLTARRLASLAKSNSFSFAAYQLTEQLKEMYMFGKLPKIEDMTWRTVEEELRHYHDFWSSKTATKEGAKKEQISQSARIFGTSPNGKPNRIMTLEEGRAYWSAYKKFNELYGHESTHLDSNRIQRILGESVEKIFDPNLDLISYLHSVLELAQYEFERGTPFTDAELEGHATALDILYSDEGDDWSWL